MLITRVNGTVRPEMDAGLRRGVAAAAVLLIVCVLAVGVVSADAVRVSDFDDLMGAITNAPSDLTIVVADDIEVSGSDAIPAITTNITLTTDNANRKIYRTEANTTPLTGMFIIQGGGKLTIRGNSGTNLTLDGAAISGNMQPLVRVENGGNFTLADGGILTNNTAYSGGGVYVYNFSTFTMSGGEISGNEASYGGGGVYISGGSTFEMSGGEISGNEASYGGGVCMFGTFEMSGGEISGNEADDGGGVGVFGGIFTMSDNAAISGNEADDGGGVYVDPYSTFELSGNGSTDSVYLSENRVITVTGPLTGPAQQQISGIKLAKSDDGTKVVTGNLHEDDLSRFKLDPSVTGVILAYQSPDKIVLLRDPTPLPPSGGSSSDGNMENAFRVLFNDGATTLSVQTDLSYGDKLTEPETPVKDGYTFAGWYKDSACTNPWDFETGIPGDMTLYAKWTAAGSSGETEATATPTKTQTAVTTPQPTKTQTAAATTSVPEATTAADVSPTLTQAPAPVAGALFGLLAAGVLLRRRFQ